MYVKPGYVAGGRYEIKARLDNMPFVSAYLAQDLRLGVPVVFKLVHTTGPTPQAHAALRERFESDVREAASLRYPGLMNVLDHGVLESGLFYVVAEWSPGITLGELIARDGPSALHHVKALWTRGLEALAEAHAHGFVHGALTAERLVVRHAGTRRARLVVPEFAVSGRVRAYDTNPATLVEGWSVTNSSPELFAGQRQPTAASDVFQAGVLMASQLHGGPVFEVASTSEMIRAFEDGVETPHGKSLRLPDAVASGPFSELLAWALALDPDKRLADASELLEALDTVPIRATVSEWRTGMRKPQPKPRPAAAPSAPSAPEATAVTPGSQPQPSMRRTTLVEAPPEPLVVPQPSPKPKRRRKRPQTMREDIPDRWMLNEDISRSAETWIKARRGGRPKRRDEGWPVWTQPEGASSQRDDDVSE